MDRLEELIHGEPCYAIKVLTFSATSAIMRNLGLAAWIENGMNFPQFALVRYCSAPAPCRKYRKLKSGGATILWRLRLGLPQIPEIPETPSKGPGHRLRA